MNESGDSLSQRFLIIAGTSKAGTTAVFNYLANHPQISATEAKETRFFLDMDYPLPSKLRCEKDGPEAYLSFFDFAKQGSEGVSKLEATPDYLYSRGTPHLIRKTLPNSRLIFFLREPVSRLISFYRFGQTMDEVPRGMTFDQFVRHQRDNGRDGFLGGRRHPVFCALRHGCYSTYLRPFIEVFGKSRLHFAFHEDLARASLEVMKGVCRFAQIDERYFEDYSFSIANKGVSVRSPALHNAYWNTKRKIRSRFRGTPMIRSLLRKVGTKVDAVYGKTNVTNRDGIKMSRSTEQFIREYYGEEAERLHEILGYKVPWSGPALGISALPE